MPRGEGSIRKGITVRPGRSHGILCKIFFTINKLQENEPTSIYQLKSIQNISSSCSVSLFVSVSLQFSVLCADCSCRRHRCEKLLRFFCIFFTEGLRKFLLEEQYFTIQRKRRNYSHFCLNKIFVNLIFLQIIRPPIFS
jgi:hypothetical protein